MAKQQKLDISKIRKEKENIKEQVIVKPTGFKTILKCQ